MGHWGVKSFENDDAHDAIDRAMETVHGIVYDELMDDGNPLSFDQVQKKLADERTLAAAVAILEEVAGTPLADGPNSWDDELRLAFAGVVVRHAELGVSIPEDLCRLAVQWLETEDLDWDEATKRSLRRQKEIDTLKRAHIVKSSSGQERGS